MIKTTIMFADGYEHDRINHLELCATFPPRNRLKVDVTDYRIIGDEIWKDEYCVADLIDMFGDKDFYKWFKEVYILKKPSSIPESTFNEK